MPSRLSKQQKARAKELAASGMSFRDIRAVTGCSISTISRILAGRVVSVAVKGCRPPRDIKAETAIKHGQQERRIARLASAMQVNVPLDTPLEMLQGVGMNTAWRLEEAGVVTVADLLELTPKGLLELPGVGMNVAREAIEAVDRGIVMDAPEGEITQEEIWSTAAAIRSGEIKVVYTH